MNNWKKQISAQIALIAMFGYTNAKIVDNGLWTDNDWYDEAAKLGVTNGVPYSNNDAMQRKLNAAMALEGGVEGYMGFENVQRVMSILSSDDFDYVFPMKNDLYTYEGMLRAIGKFPAFCGESNLDGEYDNDLDMTCARELSMLFAHFGQETGYHDPHNAIEEWRQGLWHITEWACTDPQTGRGTSVCDYKATWGWAAEEYPPQSGVQYFGRGPFQLSWNYNYGAFSEILVESKYDSKMYLLENPDLVHTDSFTVFTSALWFYMTPQTPKPSIHDVATGFMVPTSADTGAGISQGFGVTTNIINGGQECGKGFEDARSSDRIKYYKAFLEYFDLPGEDESTMTCGGQQNAFPTGGYGDEFSYFDEHWDGTRCYAVKWQTPYSINTRDDYKRCICDNKGAGAADCAQAEVVDCDTDPSQDHCVAPEPTCEEDPTQEKCEEPEPDCTTDPTADGCPAPEPDCTTDPTADGCPAPEPDCTTDPTADGCPAPEPTCEEDPSQDKCEVPCSEDPSCTPPTPIDVSDPEEAFEEIWEKANYSAEQKSRTLFQVDRSLDYIEQKLAEMHAVLAQGGLIQN